LDCRSRPDLVGRGADFPSFGSSPRRDNDVSRLLPDWNDPARWAARGLAYRLVLLMESRKAPTPGARTNVLLRAWQAADSWPQSPSAGAFLPGEMRFLRWLFGDEKRARAVIAAAEACPKVHEPQHALDELAERVRRARLAASGPWLGPAGLAGSILWADRRWYCGLPL
jgi:hypothetical protein